MAIDCTTETWWANELAAADRRTRTVEAERDSLRVRLRQAHQSEETLRLEAHRAHEAANQLRTEAATLRRELAVLRPRLRETRQLRDKYQAENRELRQRLQALGGGGQ